MLSFNCPACQYRGEADDAMAGDVIGCAKCMTHFRLPEKQAPEPPPEAVEARPSVQEPGKGAVVEAWARCPMCLARRVGTPRCTFCNHLFTTAEMIQVEQVRRQRRQSSAQAGAVLAFILVIFGLPSLVYYWIW